MYGAVKNMTLCHRVTCVPIHIDDFNDEDVQDGLRLEAGTDSSRVLQFLATNDEQAFTTSELATETGVDQDSVGVVLSQLADRGLVRQRGTHWAVGEDDRLAAYTAQTAASSVSTTDDYDD